MGCYMQLRCCGLLLLAGLEGSGMVDRIGVAGQSTANNQTLERTVDGMEASGRREWRRSICPVLLNVHQQRGRAGFQWGAHPNQFASAAPLFGQGR